MKNKVRYYLNAQGEFVIEDYNRASPFSSFFPGIAGLKGIPLWAFYVNRGQAIASFGIESKEKPILEFFAADKAYNVTALRCFRTFFKISTAKRRNYYEPFQGACAHARGSAAQTMFISSHQLRLIETNTSAGLETEAAYFTIPNEGVAALGRILTVRNISRHRQDLEVVDGIPMVIPYGVNNWFLKNMSYTIQSWMRVVNRERKIPFFKLSVDAADAAEIKYIHGGNFYMAFHRTKGGMQLIDPIVKREVIFNSSGELPCPDGFISDPHFQDRKKEESDGILPCAMAHLKLTLAPGERREIFSITGHSPNLHELNRYTSKALAPGYMEKKQGENKLIIRDIEDRVRTESGYTAFDLYARQTYLDNALRGGLSIDDPRSRQKTPIYVYGRRHGDLERDYNAFYLSPAHFSQGSGNFRDILQNRRNDVWFHPRLGDKNIRDFFNLIQADGFNPLVVKDVGHAVEAEHKEGFWIDHWTYLLDLLERYLALYPEELEDLLFHRKGFSFYRAGARVEPRNKRYVLRHGKLRQLHSVSHIPEHELSVGRGGSVYKTTLLVKLLSIAVNKLASLDASGAGIEMEADKPGWNDALNGLPALFGSSVSETMELKRLLIFIAGAFEKAGLRDSFTVSLPAELHNFMTSIAELLKETTPAHVPDADYRYWDQSNVAKELYREKTFYGFSGAKKNITVGFCKTFIRDAAVRLDRSIGRAYDSRRGIYKTYFINEVVKFNSSEKHMPLRFKQKPLPPMLEAQVHAMRLGLGSAKARALYQAVKKSELYDRRLNMYKLNAPLKDQPHEIGRMTVFQPGWLENESVWLHMEYKYILELLKNGLYDEFYAEMKQALIPFQRPEVYGRSILENSSFLVSSAYPDKTLHGRGFYARLSGSTAEFVHIWLIMCTGKEPFGLDEKGRLTLEFKPVLHREMFKDGLFRFRFLGRVNVTYHNAQRKSTYGAGAARINRVVLKRKNKKIGIKGSLIPAPYARQVRERAFDSIDVYFV